MNNTLNKNYKKNQLCNGYGLDVSCIGCCHTHDPCSEIYGLIESPIYIGIQNFPYAAKSDGSPLNEVWVGEPTPLFISFDPYMDGSVRVEGNFEESWGKLMEIVQGNTISFQTNLNNGVSLEEISKQGKLIGNVNGGIGCLIYSHKNHDTESFYRPTICQSHLCPIIRKFTKHYRNLDKSMKKFITENLGNEKFNTLSLSRAIHLLGCHPRVIKALKLNIDFINSAEENLPELNKLLEIVSK